MDLHVTRSEQEHFWVTLIFEGKIAALIIQADSTTELLLQRNQVLSTVMKMKVRISDLFGPEAAELDALKAQTLRARKG